MGLFPGPPTPRLYDRVVEVLRTRHYSRRTEQAYVHWIRSLLLFHTGTHPRELAESDSQALSDASSHQKQVKDLDFGRGEITWRTAFVITDSCRW